jgi:immunity protein 35 of polymorphic toxin system
MDFFVKKIDMNINLSKATELANRKLGILKKAIGEDLIIIENATIEKDCYWVFFYNTRSYLESENLSFALAGNSPFIIDKIHGDIYETGTAYEIEFYLNEFEKVKLPFIKEKE